MSVEPILWATFLIQCAVFLCVFSNTPKFLTASTSCKAALTPTQHIQDAALAGQAQFGLVPNVTLTSPNYHGAAALKLF
jgi:hypothetical protein